MKKFKDFLIKNIKDPIVIFCVLLLTFGIGYGIFVQAVEIPDEDMHFTGKHLHFSIDRWGEAGTDFLNDRKTTNNSGVTNNGIVRNTGQVWNDSLVGITLGEYTVSGASPTLLTSGDPSLIEVSGSTYSTTFTLPPITQDMHGSSRTFRRKSGVTLSQPHMMVHLIAYATGVSGATDEIRLPSGNTANMYTIYGNNNFVTLRVEYANSGTTCYWVVDDESDFVKQDINTYVTCNSGVSNIAGVSIYTVTGINASGNLDASYNSINPGDVFTWKVTGTIAGTASLKRACIISGNVRDGSGVTLFTLVTPDRAQAGDFNAEITMYNATDAAQKWNGYLSVSGTSIYVNYTDTTWDMSGVTYFGLYVGTDTTPSTMTVNRAELWRGNR